MDDVIKNDGNVEEILSILGVKSMSAEKMYEFSHLLMGESDFITVERAKELLTLI